MHYRRHALQEGCRTRWKQKKAGQDGGAGGAGVMQARMNTRWWRDRTDARQEQCRTG